MDGDLSGGRPFMDGDLSGGRPFMDGDLSGGRTFMDGDLSGGRPLNRATILFNLISVLFRYIAKL